MDRCEYCKKYHPFANVCDGYIEHLSKKGQTRTCGHCKKEQPLYNHPSEFKCGYCNKDLKDET